jgi:hypothetical protein
MPPKFNGDDNHWVAWSKQWRTYLQAKEWLTTAEHPEGPGAIGFDLTINAKIYNCLINLCRKGKAITDYLRRTSSRIWWLWGKRATTPSLRRLLETKASIPEEMCGNDETH